MTQRTFNTTSAHRHHPTFRHPSAEYSSTDQQYRTVRELINDQLQLLPPSKHTQIKLHNWLKKLDKEQYCGVDKQNRNNYLQLINLMLESKVLVPPFSSFPKQEIPVLNRNDYNHIINSIEQERRKNTSKKSSQFVSPSTSLTKKVRSKLPTCDSLQLKNNFNSVACSQTNKKPLPHYLSFLNISGN